MAYCGIIIGQGILLHTRFAYCDIVKVREYLCTWLVHCGIVRKLSRSGAHSLRIVPLLELEGIVAHQCGIMALSGS